MVATRAVVMLSVAAAGLAVTAACSSSGKPDTGSGLRTVVAPSGAPEAKPAGSTALAGLAAARYTRRSTRSVHRQPTLNDAPR
jgi:hypothetical protein